MAVVLERRSAPERVRSIADSGAVGRTHSTGCRARFSMCFGRAGGLRACSCCMRPERYLHGLTQGARGFRSDRQAFSVGPRGEPCAKLSRNAASPVHLADEPLPAHCWRHSPGHRDPCMGIRGTGDVACRDRVRPCRHWRRRCRNACAVDPRMVASLITWAPLTRRPA